ncbi:MAG: GNAT family protein [Sediminibacterium sp.]
MDFTFDFSKDYILEDDRVLLRPLQREDYSNLLHFSLNEPETWAFSLQKAAGRENLVSYIQTALDARMARNQYPFVVFDKRTHEYAGSTRFYDIQPAYQTLHLGFTWYGKAFRGTGLNRHCKFLLLQFAFEQLDMERIEFRADNDNARSIAAMKAIGCKVEGVLRHHMPKGDGGRRDSIVLSILKEEWFAEVRNNLAKKL